MRTWRRQGKRRKHVAARSAFGRSGQGIQERLEELGGPDRDPRRVRELPSCPKRVAATPCAASCSMIRTHAMHTMRAVLINGDFLDSCRIASTRLCSAACSASQFISPAQEETTIPASFARVVANAFPPDCSASYARPPANAAGRASTPNTTSTALPLKARPPCQGRVYTSPDTRPAICYLLTRSSLG